MTRRNRPIAGKCSAEKKGQQPNGLREGGKPAPVTGVRVRNYKDLDRKRVINHIAADIRIVTVWLGALLFSRRAPAAGAARLCRRDPIVFPAAPRRLIGSRKSP